MADWVEIGFDVLEEPSEHGPAKCFSSMPMGPSSFAASSLESRFSLVYLLTKVHMLARKPPSIYWVHVLSSGTLHLNHLFRMPQTEGNLKNSDQQWAEADRLGPHVRTVLLHQSHIHKDCPLEGLKKTNSLAEFLPFCLFICEGQWQEDPTSKLLRGQAQVRGKVSYTLGFLFICEPR